MSLNNEEQFQPLSADGIVADVNGPLFPEDPVANPRASVAYCLGLLGFTNSVHDCLLDHVLTDWWGIMTTPLTELKQRLNTCLWRNSL